MSVRNVEYVGHQMRGCGLGQIVRFREGTCHVLPLTHPRNPLGVGPCLWGMPGPAARRTAWLVLADLMGEAFADEWAVAFGDQCIAHLFGPHWCLRREDVESWLARALAFQAAAEDASNIDAEVN